MNRINPLHISLLLVILLFVFIFKLSNAKTELLNAQHAYKDNKEIALKLSALRDAYTKKFIIPSSIKPLAVQKKIKNGISISFKKMDLKSLNLLMQKVLNETYNIIKLEIVRLSDTEVSLKMEIKW